MTRVLRGRWRLSWMRQLALALALAQLAPVQLPLQLSTTSTLQTVHQLKLCSLHRPLLNLKLRLNAAAPWLLKTHGLCLRLRLCRKLQHANEQLKLKPVLPWPAKKR